MNYVKLKFILLSLRELQLLGVEAMAENEDHEIYAFRYIPTQTKTNLDRSGIYRKLKNDFGVV